MKPLDLYFKISLIKRYTEVSLRVIETEGLKVFFRLFLEKIRRKNPEGPVGEDNYKLHKQLGHLVFPECHNPEVSVIVISDNDTVLTYSCLSYLHQHTNGVPFEVILSCDAASYLFSQLLGQVENVRVIQHKTGMAYAERCHLGIEKATGRYVIFLTNDMMVTKNWLAPLADTFKTQLQVGAVGCKIIFPDGRLAEAGFRWDRKEKMLLSHGYGDDPLKPQYNFLRTEDMLRSCCFLTTRALFESIYQADADLLLMDDTHAAFELSRKIADKELKLYYHPHAMVVDFGNEEKYATGRKMSDGVQIPSPKNRKKQALVVEIRMITPDQDSASYRMFGMLTILREMGYHVTFATANLDYDEKYARKLQQEGIEVLYHPYVPSIEKYIEENGKRFDAIFLSRIHVADRLTDHAKYFAPEAKIIFDTVDLHFLREERMADVAQCAKLKSASEKMKKRELEAAKKSDVTVVVSPVEKKVLAGICPEVRVEVLSNIHEVFGSNTPFEERKDLMFIGGFEHTPNVDAMNFFVKDIFPIIQEKMGKEISFYIVGSKPPSEIKSLASDNIIVTGYVEDISPFFNKCRIFVAPLRYGAGVKGKINMSMSYGLPVVGTGISVEGMYLENGKNALVADDPETFADHVIRLYNDKELWNQISQNSIRNVKDHFSYDVAKKSLSEILNTP